MILGCPRLKKHQQERSTACRGGCNVEILAIIACAAAHNSAGIIKQPPHIELDVLHQLIGLTVSHNEAYGELTQLLKSHILQVS